MFSSRNFLLTLHIKSCQSYPLVNCTPTKLNRCKSFVPSSMYFVPTSVGWPAMLTFLTANLRSWYQCLNSELVDSQRPDRDAMPIAAAVTCSRTRRHHPTEMTCVCSVRAAALSLSAVHRIRRSANSVMTFSVNETDAFKYMLIQKDLSTNRCQFCCTAHKHRGEH